MNFPKLDAKYEGTIRKVKDGTILPPERWVCFDCKDTAFALTLPTYRENCVQLGADPKHIALVDELIQRISLWRAKHLQLLKTPDAEGEFNLYDATREES